MTDRYTPTSYEFDADGIKATIDLFDFRDESAFWRVYFSRVTTSDAVAAIKAIEETKFQTAEYAANAIERMIHERPA